MRCWRFIFGVLSILASASAWAVDPIPAARKYDWTYTGVPGGIPNRTTVCSTLNPGASAASINTAITNCPSGQVVYLNAGTYNIGASKILINRSNVTLRGAGADQTVILGTSTMLQAAGGYVSIGRAITGGGTKGTNTITVGSTASLTVGTMIELKRDNDAAFVTSRDPARALTQVNVITAVNGTTLTLRNPLFFDFSTGNAQVDKYYVAVPKLSGVEDLRLDHQNNTGATWIEAVDSFWFKGVESTRCSGYHFIFIGTANVEIRDSFVHDAASGGPNNSGLNFYGSYDYSGGNSNAKIENNIFNKNFPAIELNNSSSGLYIGYNYAHGSIDQYGNQLVTWTFDDGHAPHNSFNLYEGNIGEQFGADNYFGGTSFATSFRNWWSGVNLNYSATGDAVWILRLAYNYNVIGNVLGSSAQNPVAYSGCDGPYIYRLGYPNLGNCDTTPYDGFYPTGNYPDPTVLSSIMRWGNYDYYNDTTRWQSSEVPAGVSVPADQLLPASYVHGAKPSWFGAVAWPPIGPDVTGGNFDTAGKVNKIPARLCWESRNLASGGTFSAAACYTASSLLSAPTNLRWSPR